ncbi:hypothetical protein Xsto_02831 [Xenorhabdus stockiae]|uniref:Uncharacterized protein n=1 Tax=Xenorhabdus stockiae TaxID=351614 RepID=A0A2D0KMT2_9GAMM|nr:hypothetical protein Xsto_02831 [Xenorhabdus stockiae]
MLRAGSGNEFSNAFMELEMSEHNRFWNSVNSQEITYIPNTTGNRYPRLRLHFIDSQLFDLQYCTAPGSNNERTLYSNYAGRPGHPGVWNPLFQVISSTNPHYDNISAAVESVRRFWT